MLNSPEKQDSLILSDKITSVHMHLLFWRQRNLFMACNQHFALKSNSHRALFSGIAPLVVEVHSHKLRSGSQVSQLQSVRAVFSSSPPSPVEQVRLSLSSSAEVVPRGPQMSHSLEFILVDILTFNMCFCF